MKILNQKRKLQILAIGLPLLLGCSQSNQAILPSGQLTEEQKAAIKADDDRVNQEESQGSFGKKKK